MAAANVTQTPDLHYYKLKPDRRQQVCSLLGGKPARAFCLLSYKTNVRNYYTAKLGKFDAPRFFNWCSSLLIGRFLEFAENDPKHRGAITAPATFVFSKQQGKNI